MPTHRSRWVLGGVAVVLVGLGLGALGLLARSDRSDHSDGVPAELFLEAAASPGPDPFAPSVATPVAMAPASPVTEPVTERSTVVTATTGAAGAVAVVRFDGATPGLYGGTRDRSSCDVEALADFLETHQDKLTAWSSVLGDGSLEARSYLATLTPVVLRRDTRVTNHGFRNGRATPRQAVLQRGTAVLVDRLGRPRVKCACGNPLLDPVAGRRAPRLRGTPWAGFDPGATIAVGPGDLPIDRFGLVDLGTGDGFERPPGTAGDDDGPAIDLGASGWPATKASGSRPSTAVPAPVTDPGASGDIDINDIDPLPGEAEPPAVAATAPLLTTVVPAATAAPTAVPTVAQMSAPAVAPPTVPAPTTAPTFPVVTPLGRATASSTYSAQYSASSALDEDLTTSWFSAGAGAGGTTQFTWQADAPITIRRIEVLSNSRNGRADFRRGYGFGRVVIEVLDQAGSVVFTDDRALSGTPDPDAAFDLDATGVTVRLTFSGHEASDCGGFAELVVRGTP